MYNLIATSTFGLESIVAKELKSLGYFIEKVENGKVYFKGEDKDIAICNICLRTADRILIKMAEFKAYSFEELFQGTKKVNWWNIIPQNGFMHVTGKSVKSTLYSVPDCQRIVKKAVIENMKEKYKVDWFEENGEEYKIEVSILKDKVTLTIDTTGAGLHKRGYREIAGEAPLKETLAAALVLLSNWNGKTLLIDPCCGSGTIAIEAAMIGKNIAPGINRKFVSEDWPIISKKAFKEAREFALKRVNDNEVQIFAGDIDGKVLKVARENANKAGVGEYIHFQKANIKDFSSKKKYGVLITNPPYGERIGSIDEINLVYNTLGEIYRKNDTWSIYALTSHPYFEKKFGEKANKNRKLYNGKLKCYYYQYIRKSPM